MNSHSPALRLVQLLGVLSENNLIMHRELVIVKTAWLQVISGLSLWDGSGLILQVPSDGGSMYRRKYWEILRDCFTAHFFSWQNLHSEICGKRDKVEELLKHADQCSAAIKVLGFQHFYGVWFFMVRCIPLCLLFWQVKCQLPDVCVCAEIPGLKHLCVQNIIKAIWVLATWRPQDDAGDTSESLYSGEPKPSSGQAKLSSSHVKKIRK